MSRMRTLTEGFAEYKRNDPNSALTLTALRRLVTTGTIPSVRIGTKYLFNLDSLEEFLSGSYPVEEQETAASMSGTIRQLEA